jgi:hypothetical protein
MFIENKYTNWYYSIINNAKLQLRKKKNGIYYESHHIIPKSMGGIEEVLLTAKEHFICHILLCKMVIGKDKHKMINALIKMSFSKSRGQERYTAKSYSIVRKFIANKNSEMFKGIPKSESTKQNMKGRSGTWIRTELHKKAMSEYRRGKNTGDINTSKRPEVRDKLSKKAKYLGNNPTEAMIIGRIKMRESLKKKKWFTNGEKDVFTEICPEGYKAGRTNNRKDMKNVGKKKSAT